jgi:hypothetical protein
MVDESVGLLENRASVRSRCFFSAVSYSAGKILASQSGDDGLISESVLVSD